ncbi:glycoside hydrolase family 16 protein [Puia sp. P3]|uniref:glycoside hydrolase family 16 protein n=1 Tax=Puia sp. P3 TaxID=3423952 RepID=UPI003D672E62
MHRSWGYDIGTGSGGWGNNELEYYTSRTDNAIVSNGTLKIIAKKESYNGSAYTSARLLTKGLFSWQYGKIEVRAKLPVGKGTRPGSGCWAIISSRLVGRPAGRSILWSRTAARRIPFMGPCTIRSRRMPMGTGDYDGCDGRYGFSSLCRHLVCGQHPAAGRRCCLLYAAQ